MLNELSCWKWDWNAIGAVATTAGTLVALWVAVFPSWRARRKTQALARALFGVDVLNVLVVGKELSAPNAMGELKSGRLPSERQKRALSFPTAKEHMATLGMSTTYAEQLAQLLCHCEELRWRIDNLSNPDIDYDKGKCLDVERNRTVNWMLAISQASTVGQLASSVHTQLYSPRQRRWWRK